MNDLGVKALAFEEAQRRSREADAAADKALADLGKAAEDLWVPSLERTKARLEDVRRFAESYENPKEIAP